MDKPAQLFTKIRNHPTKLALSTDWPSFLQSLVESELGTYLTKNVIF